MSRRETLRHPEDTAAPGAAYCGLFATWTESDRECRNCARERDVDRPKREWRYDEREERKALRSAAVAKIVADRQAAEVALLAAVGKARLERGTLLVPCRRCGAKQGFDCVRKYRSPQRLWSSTVQAHVARVEFAANRKRWIAATGGP